MKKIAVVLFITLVVQLACGLTPGATPTQDKNALATEVSSHLTAAIPTSTQAPFVTLAPEFKPTRAIRPSATATVTATLLPNGTIPIDTSLTPTTSPTTTETGTVTATGTATATITSTPLISPTYIGVFNPTGTQIPSEPTYSPSIKDPRDRLGDPTWYDNMTDDKKWAKIVDNLTSISISGGVLTYTSLATGASWRMPTAPSFESFYAEITTTKEQCAGLDYFGLVFRAFDIHNPNQLFLYAVSCDGRYSLMKWDGAMGDMGTLVPWTVNRAIIRGAYQSNRISVWMTGSRIVLFANGKALVEIWDGNYPQGYVGILIRPKETKPFTIDITEMSLWDLGSQ